MCLVFSCQASLVQCLDWEEGLQGGILFYIDVESLLLEEGWAICLPGTGAADRVTKMLIQWGGATVMDKIY